MAAMTDEEDEVRRQELDAHYAAQAEAAKAVNRGLLAPLVALGLGGTDPLNCSLSALASALRTHALTLGPVDVGFPSYAAQVSTVLDGLDRKMRTMVAQNVAVPKPVAAPEEPQGE